MPRENLAFAVAAGSVTGREHVRALRDGQDGYATVATPRLAAVVVTDGCGSSPRSEVGARLGAAWLVRLVEAAFEDVGTEAEASLAAEAVTRGLVARLDATARSLSADGSLDPAPIGEYLLFTFLAAVVTEAVAVVFGVGDGVAWVDGALATIEAGPDNAPPYAAYALLGAVIRPQVVSVRAAADVDAIAIATDGAGVLATEEFARLAADDQLSERPSRLRKRLVVLSDQRRFRDDATVAVVKRRAPRRAS